MSDNLLRLTCVVLLCSIAVAGNQSPTQKLDSAWKQYYNAQWHYCVDYPVRWARGDAYDGAGLIVSSGARKHWHPLGEIDVSVLLNTVYKPISNPAPTPSGLDEVMADHLDGLRKFVRAQNLVILKTQSFQLSGLPAVMEKQRYYDPQDRANWTDEIVLTRDGATLFRLEMECKAEHTARFEAVFERVVNSFQIGCKARR